MTNDLRKYSDPSKYSISIDSDDNPDGSDGGYGAHGNYVIPEAMMEIVSLRAEVYKQREALAEWMMAHGMATGDGDTTGDLLRALDFHWREMLASLRHLRAERDQIAEALRYLIEELDGWTGAEGNVRYLDSWGAAQKALSELDVK